MSVVTQVVGIVVSIIILVGIITFLVYFLKKPKCQSPDAFSDIFTGHCYKCPKNMPRTWESVTSPKACQGDCKNIYGDRAFQDFLSGKCYACPNGTDRTLEAVTAEKACQGPCDKNIWRQCL